MKQSTKKCAKISCMIGNHRKMKPDTTSVPHILSSKIRPGREAVLFILLLALLLVQPHLIWAENSLLVSPEALNSMPQDQVVIIDTRSKFNYLLGHIPNAVHLGSWEDFTHRIDGVRGLLIEDRRFIAEKLKPHGIDLSKRIVVYGEPTDPWRTDGRFFWMFERFGFTKVAILEGGLDHWQNSGRKIERGRAKSVSVSSLTVDDIRLNEKVSADQDWIAQRLDSDDLTLIDNRTRDEYNGSQPYGSARSGHIPTAVHIHWPDFFSSKGHIKNQDELSKLLKRFNINSDDKIVVYCTGGVRSAMAYFVLRYLGYEVRNYDGSWWDWSLNPKLPIETS